MKTIGSALKEARMRKRYSLSKVESLTRIKKEFIEAIENESWPSLPEYPVVVGFVKNISKALGLNEKSAVALFRRDYPPKILSVNPKPDVGGKFVWSPKLTFLVGIATVAVLILGYLGFQYSKFVSAPSLVLYSPQDGEVIKEPKVNVKGKTDSEATVKVNNQPVIVSEDGEFEAQIEIFEGTTQIEAKATSRAGKETLLRRNIKPEFTN